MLDGLLTYAAQDQGLVLGILGALILLVVILMAVARTARQPGRARR